MVRRKRRLDASNKRKEGRKNAVGRASSGTSKKSERRGNFKASERHASSARPSSILPSTLLHLRAVFCPRPRRSTGPTNSLDVQHGRFMDQSADQPLVLNCLAWRSQAGKPKVQPYFEYVWICSGAYHIISILCSPFRQRIVFVLN